MTRKDYILIASALRKRILFEASIESLREIRGGVMLAALSIADAILFSNPKFDREHFLAMVRGEKALDSKPGVKQ